jgi:hypothetical protein
MGPETTTESDEILEYRFGNQDCCEGDYSYNEAIMDESLTDFLREKPDELH